MKTVNSDAKKLAYVPGGTVENGKKNAQATEMGLRGILGVLVVLDYKRSVADIYVREMPFEGWGLHKTQGIGYFAHHNGTHLVKEIPFKNPFLDPSSRAPEVHNPSNMPF